MKKLLRDLGSVTAVIGAQWGDEGKGKVTDILGEEFDVIARACGGANAGHTIVINGKKTVFRLLPSGCMHPQKPVILGAGMVIHLPTLLEEIRMLEKEGIDIIDRLFISASAHIVFDFHKDLDAWQEEQKGGKGIGTTRRGIGPTYADKMSRTGIRMESLTADLRAYLQERKDALAKTTGVSIDVQKELAQIEEARKILSSRISPVIPTILRTFLVKKQSILIEGAQATLLDIDHGTYPYVTSSSTTAAGALQGLGLPPRALETCIGVVKAYCTRVGEGAFPTEVKGETGDRIRERGGEYGSVTKRPRRCGWLSIAELRYSALINGFDFLNLTKLDVLDEESEIPILTEGGTWEKMSGWKTSTVGITDFKKLPKEAQQYVEWIEKASGIPVRLIGTGPGREEMIVR